LQFVTLGICSVDAEVYGHQVNALFLSLILIFSFQAKALKGVLGELAPYAYLDKGQPKGSMIEVIGILEKKSGVPMTLSVAPLGRIFEQFKIGQVDFVLVPNLPEMAGLDGKKIPLFNVILALYSPAASPILKMDKIKGKIGRLRGACRPLQGRNDIQWVEVRSYIQSFQLMARKRIDAFCGETLAMDYARRVNKVMDKDIHILTISEHENWIYFQNRVEEPQFQKVKNAILEIQENGLLLEIQKKHFELEKP
jgi:ABC-type amino acid transport substrate-binding protein